VYLVGELLRRRGERGGEDSGAGAAASRAGGASR